MRTASVTFLSILGSALATPAVVWNKASNAQGTLRTSNDVPAHSLFSDLLSTETPESSSSLSVIFLLGRSSDGSESLSALASSGSLPTVQEKYANANAIHHHVSGVESPDTVERVARAAAGKKVVSINLGELDNRLGSATSATAEMEVAHNGATHKSHKRAQALKDANVVIVKVNPSVDTAALDAAVAKAIDHEGVASVVLTAVRSHEEVKNERLQDHRRRLSKMKVAGSSGNSHPGRRRLEDAEQEEAQDNANNGGDDMTGVYYVNMTPNILAGILFGMLFVVIVFIGVTCMGMIAGQEVYVKKLPPVGREA